MIPSDFVQSYQMQSPWQTLQMVEQDMVISRALIDLYNDPLIQKSLVFRGGTALNKIFINPPARYSEDIDFVQLEPGAIGPIIDKIRNILMPWLGSPKWKITERSAKLIYKYQAVDETSAKLKLEINTTEHFQVLPIQPYKFSHDSKWLSGDCDVSVYALEELMATKIRALYQRRKGRDLFDVWYVFSNQMADLSTSIEILKKYCDREKLVIYQKTFGSNLALKAQDQDFRSDMSTLLPEQVRYNFDEAHNFVMDKIVSKL